MTTPLNIQKSFEKLPTRKSYEFDECGVTIIELDMHLSDFLETAYANVPVGFALIGGAARDIAFGQLRDMDGLKVRDVDIVDFESQLLESNERSDVYRKLSAKYMPDDYAHGHGVKREDPGQYFTSRDFTINQVAVVRGEEGWQLRMTQQAVVDTENSIIRPTIAEHDTKQGYELYDKLAIKAVLLEQVLQTEGLEPSIRGIDMKRYARERGANLFHIGLGIQKACDWGGEIPRLFFDSLARYGFVDKREHRTLVDLAYDVGEMTDFGFRGNAWEQIEQASRQLHLTQRIGDVALKSTK